MAGKYLSLLAHFTWSTAGCEPWIATEIHESYSQLRDFAWQEGYGAFSVSKSEEARVERYIRNQEHHHRKRTFKEELIGLLEKHGIEYDKRHVWD